jgi:hypothetical protein
LLRLRWVTLGRPKWNDGTLVKDGVEPPLGLIAEQRPIVTGSGRVLGEQYVAQAKRKAAVVSGELQPAA